MGGVEMERWVVAPPLWSSRVLIPSAFGLGMVRGGRCDDCESYPRACDHCWHQHHRQRRRFAKTHVTRAQQHTLSRQRRSWSMTTNRDDSAKSASRDGAREQRSERKGSQKTA